MGEKGIWDMQEWLEKTGSLFERAFISGDRWKLYIEGLGVTVEIAFFAAILGLIKIGRAHV